MLTQAFQNTADVLQAIAYDAETLRHAAQNADAAARSQALADAQFRSGEAGALTALAAVAADRQAQLALVQGSRRALLRHRRALAGAGRRMGRRAAAPQDQRR